MLITYLLASIHIGDFIFKDYTFKVEFDCGILFNLTIKLVILKVYVKIVF